VAGEVQHPVPGQRGRYRVPGCRAVGENYGWQTRRAERLVDLTAHVRESGGALRLGDGDHEHGRIGVLENGLGRTRRAGRVGAGLAEGAKRWRVRGNYVVHHLGVRVPGPLADLGGVQRQQT